MGRRRRTVVRPTRIPVPVQAPDHRQHTTRYISLSRWAKKHRDRLSRVNFGAEMPDRNWRRKREYADWRNDVLLRDRFRCTACSSRRKLSVHHIIPASVAPELRYEVFNGQTLCERCHKEQEHQYDPEFWKRMVTRRPK